MKQAPPGFLKFSIDTVHFKKLFPSEMLVLKFLIVNLGRKTKTDGEEGEEKERSQEEN